MRPELYHVISSRPAQPFSRLLLCFLVAALFMACDQGSKKIPVAAVDTPAVLETKKGLASYYARSLQGEETASGEAFDNAELVAAHPSYPLGTLVRVKNLENGSSVPIIRINDRGPSDQNQREGVIIDLSRSAARKLGMMKDGRVQVQVDVLQWGDNSRGN